MNALYINIGSVTAGVRKKLESKCFYLKHAGIDIKLIMVVPSDYPRNEAYENVIVDFSLAKKVSGYPIIWRLVPILEQWAVHRAIAQYVKRINSSYIIIRYPIADYFMLRWLKQLKGKTKVVFEHNTMEIHELRTRAKHSFYYKYSLVSEFFFGSSVRRMVSGLIGVTGEITQEQLRRAGVELPATTVSNGIDVGSLPVWKGRPFDGKELRIILLAGSEAPWHGVDILLNSLEEYKGDCRIFVHLVGKISITSLQRIKSFSNVVYTPTVYGQALDELIDSAHIGVGTLGIESSFMKEACTLKVREYWARGLPFILGYEDTDLISNFEMIPYFLKVTIERDSKYFFSLQQVVDFANNVYKISDRAEQMRLNANYKIHYGVKAKEVVSFLTTI